VRGFHRLQVDSIVEVVMEREGSWIVGRAVDVVWVVARGNHRYGEGRVVVGMTIQTCSGRLD